MSLKNKRIPLLPYWTARYLITLCIGIIIIGLVSTVWLKHNTAQKRLDSIRVLAEAIAENSVDSSGTLYIDPRLSRDIDRRQRFLDLGPELMLLVANSEGELVYSRPGIPPPDLLQSITIPADQEQGTQQLNNGPDTKMYIVKQAIKSDHNTIGSVYILYPLRDINRNPEEIQFLFLMLGGLALLGWIIIYALTRKMAEPIKNVVDAAQQIVAGDYNLALNTDVREQEIYDLLKSFEDMAERLRQLESLRTELLAGVTHELKTPVTAISGLIQAVQDGVVEGEEAHEFLTICSSETDRLQKMVEDLLDFNSFVTGDIKVEKSSCNINQLIGEITYQWLIAQEENGCQLQTRVPEQDVVTATDAMRLQQIMYDLLNNACQAATPPGNIEVVLYEQDDEIRIDVTDDGLGIPDEEQDLIFERFFRGQAKKIKYHGLGLGLSFSKMIARALGGDLILKSSTPDGTTFTLVLDKSK